MYAKSANDKFTKAYVRNSSCGTAQVFKCYLLSVRGRHKTCKTASNVVSTLNITYPPPQNLYFGNLTNGEDNKVCLYCHSWTLSKFPPSTQTSSKRQLSASARNLWHFINNLVLVFALVYHQINKDAKVHHLLIWSLAQEKCFANSNTLCRTNHYKHLFWKGAPF